ncbi:MAG: hypothetical protein K0S74_804 [Chlamydiales bacterium]|jgi:hypothetical protein|nr:hypothetical protein [Chlamydiales bacterium]
MTVFAYPRSNFFLEENDCFACIHMKKESMQNFKIEVKSVDQRNIIIKEIFNNRGVKENTNSDITITIGACENHKVNLRELRFFLKYGDNYNLSQKILRYCTTLIPNQALCERVWIREDERSLASSSEGQDYFNNKKAEAVKQLTEKLMQD